ncbi:hypothetical protein K6V96_09675 [Streptococcus suis]|uniref:Uncharacterized protein n=2 Tax=Streptococcus suis TaxID=1307 RepID=A0A426G0T2_STRSU|nr:hypothetical protein [Streptococcus suis]EHC01619.1 hypothetical protein SSUR61_0133 [Streptococcus suis R61]MBY4956364.1 hypothetical protein [Streptococcus suis]MBY5017468.1 hypothetical protein [Streptococcus suis]MBY5030772.1 hypothetical protein [Streptococcus suis]NQK50440.1 hypothetical protein [Streptococcus suis]
MRKKTSFIICSTVIIITNILMMTLFYNGEEIGTNLFVIGITLFLFPFFLSAVDANKISAIRLESSALIVMATLSLLRLVNRIDTMPVMVNTIMVLVVLGTGSMLLVASITRIFQGYKK